MARAHGDDLRRKFLSAYDEGEETLEKLADRFLVSLGWAKKNFCAAESQRAGRAGSASAPTDADIFLAFIDRGCARALKPGDLVMG